MEVSKAKAETELRRRWAQDLSVCTADEIRARWATPELREAIDKIEVPGITFETRLIDHNPIYYLAERVFFDNVITDPKFLYPPYHRDKLCKFLLEYMLDPDPPESGALFHGPRETYKSRFAHCVLAAWLLLRHKHLYGRDVRIVLRHHKEQMAAANLAILKAAFKHHAWMREVWPDACPPEEKDFGDSTKFTLPWVEAGRITEPSVFATGLTATTTGFHCDFNLNDDLVTEEHRKSQQIREDAKIRYSAMRFQLEHTEGREVNTGTPYHPRDLGMMMQSATKEDAAGNTVPVYRKMVVDALDADMDEKGVLAHPFKLSEKILEKRRQEEIALHGHDDYWYLQYRCRAGLLRTQVASSEWLRHIKIEEVERTGMVVIPVDAAWKGTANQGKGDSASIQAWVLQRKGGVVTRTLLDGVHSNELSSNDGEREIFRLMAKWGCYHVAPEEHGGQVFRTNLRNTATALGQRLVIVDLKMKQLQKHNRFVQFLKELEAGRVFVSSSCDPGVLAALVEQIDGYQGPDTLEHDDALDAASYSCDPGILEKWVPVWGSALPQPSWLRQRMLEQRRVGDSYRTRYCTA
jgi:hypothetical protein